MEENNLTNATGCAMTSLLSYALRITSFGEDMYFRNPAVKPLIALIEESGSIEAEKTIAMLELAYTRMLKDMADTPKADG
jgi:hypothetical protein